MTGLGLVGFVDDFIKIYKQTSLGLRSGAKLAGQAVVGAMFALQVLQLPGRLRHSPRPTRTLSFLRDFGPSIGVLPFVLWIVFMIAGTSNAVNLTDGLDGLATGAAILVLAAYVLIANWQLRNDCTVALTPNCYAVRDPLDLAVVAASVLGACFGFLWWNAPPARIFMGDTGSLALGGVLAGLAVTTRTQLLLVILGGLFVIITLSVIIQVGSFKMTGKRVFRMAPLQHHFELLGWAETTIVIRFWLICRPVHRARPGHFLRGVAARLLRWRAQGRYARWPSPRSRRSFVAPHRRRKQRRGAALAGRSAVCATSLRSPGRGDTRRMSALRRRLALRLGSWTSLPRPPPRPSRRPVRQGRGAAGRCRAGWRSSTGR